MLNIHFISMNTWAQSTDWTSHLSLPVDPNDAWGGLVWSGDKDGLPTDAVHVDAGACLQVIQVNVAIFGNKENHILLGAYLSKEKRMKYCACHLFCFLSRLI